MKFIRFQNYQTTKLPPLLFSSTHNLHCRFQSHLNKSSLSLFWATQNQINSLTVLTSVRGILYQVIYQTHPIKTIEYLTTYIYFLILVHYLSWAFALSLLLPIKKQFVLILKGATSQFAHLEKCSLNFSSASFVIHVNFLHP